ncbi:MAG: DnaK suppressor protein [Pseudonocardiales bacterium]|jgi:DnaK suppressor protein|nr:DnaK suppressor protein [Pseudonocardiales bacterium]
MTRTTRSTLAARGEPLSDNQLAVLRSMLEEQRSFRIDQLAQLHLPGPHGPLSSTDPEIFSSLAAGARSALRDVQSALWRMDEGRYGVCTTCGDTIGLERLEILPATRLCLPCQRGDA